MKALIARFLSHVQQGEPCWEWTGCRDSCGYGMTPIGAANARGAHRAAWELFVGSIPEGMDVDHICFNPGCVRIEHLRLLTASENRHLQRSALKTHCSEGHEFTAENTYIRPKTYRGRQCRKCNAAAARRYKDRKRAA